jgi:hypothetical protein
MDYLVFSVPQAERASDDEIAVGVFTVTHILAVAVDVLLHLLVSPFIEQIPSVLILPKSLIFGDVAIIAPIGVILVRPTEDVGR